MPRPEDERRVVVGGSVASLVAAERLAATGTDVDLLLPTRGVAGRFAALPHGRRRLSQGLTLLELDHGRALPPPPPLDSYVPGPAAHEPWLPLVSGYLRWLAGAGLREAPAPRLLANGRLVADVHLTADPRGLTGSLDRRERAAVAAEAGAACEAHGDAGVLGGHDLWRLDVETASRLNHGATFHRRFVAPVAAKLRPGGGEGVVAALRRHLWLPLIEPRALVQAMEAGGAGDGPRRRFHVDASGGSDAVITELCTRIERSPRVRVRTPGALRTVVRRPGGLVRMGFADGTVLDARWPILGAGPREVLAAAGAVWAPPRLTAHLVWLEVATTDLAGPMAPLHIADDDVPAVRVGPGGRSRPGRTLICVELAAGAVADLAEHGRGDTGVDGGAVAEDVVRSLGLVADGAPVALVHERRAPALVEPTHEALAGWVEARARFDAAHLDAVLVGGAAAFGADSLNEQVLQGLAAACAVADATVPLPGATAMAEGVG